MLPSAHLALNFDDLVASLRQGFLQAFHFVRQFGLIQMLFCNRGTGAADEQDFSTADARRNRNAPECPFSRFRRLWHGRCLAQAGWDGKRFWQKSLDLGAAGFIFVAALRLTA
jgi:hypothetical protein